MNAVPGSAAARRLVPGYAIAGAVGTLRADLPVETMLTTTSAGIGAVVDLQFERRDVVLLCRRPQSVAEVAARLRLPLGVARLLVSDLAADGHVTVHADDRPRGRPDRALLERLLTGLQRVL